MTKPNPFNTCIYCGNIFRKSFAHQNICSAICSFWSRVEKTDNCWLWTGSKHVSGYGEFRFNSKLIRAHRFSYEMHKGPLGEKFACHTCDNPTCVNPDHIIAGTHEDNMSHVRLRGRSPKMKLSLKQVDEVRRLIKMGDTLTSIAKRFDVCHATISHIKHGRNRKPSPAL